MVLTDVITLVSLLSLGGIIGAAGFARLFRLDRLRWERMRHDACRWHQWQFSEGRASLICSLCGKRSRLINPSQDRGPDIGSSGTTFLP
jgi:hypothetical protein